MANCSRAEEVTQRERRAAWDVLMLNARSQAENYARAPALSA